MKMMRRMKSLPAQVDGNTTIARFCFLVFCCDVDQHGNQRFMAADEGAT